MTLGVGISAHLQYQDVTVAHHVQGLFAAPLLRLSASPRSNRNLPSRPLDDLYQHLLALFDAEMAIMPIELVAVSVEVADRSGPLKVDLDAFAHFLEGNENFVDFLAWGDCQPPESPSCIPAGPCSWLSPLPAPAYRSDRACCRRTNRARSRRSRPSASGISCSSSFRAAGPAENARYLPRRPVRPPR